MATGLASPKGWIITLYPYSDKPFRLEDGVLHMERIRELSELIVPLYYDTRDRSEVVLLEAGILLLVQGLRRLCLISRKGVSTAGINNKMRRRSFLLRLHLFCAALPQIGYRFIEL